MPEAEALFVSRGAVFVIAGPCALESEAMALTVAERLAEASRELKIPVVFKASFLKDNRTRGDAPRGVGLAEGLRILARVRSETGLPVLSDVHTEEDARRAGEVLDILQIPAFLCRQTRLVEAAAATGRPLNVKKGQFLPPSNARFIVEKARAAGAPTVAITERGASFGYGDLVVDPRVFPLLDDLGVCAIYDATHSLQTPGGGETGGDRRFLRPLTRAALAAGAVGVFFETHPDPATAISDRATQLPLAEARDFLAEIRDVAGALRPFVTRRSGMGSPS